MVDIDDAGVASRAGNANANGHGVAQSRSRGGGGLRYAVKIASIFGGKVNLFERSFKKRMRFYR